jgi:hypothetical protein
MQAKQRRARADAAGADPYQYLLNCFVRERKGDKKRELALQLLPYVRPRLKAVELSGQVDHEIVVTIGGE